MAENRYKNNYDLLFVPEKVLSTKGRRELRILICFNSRKRNGIHKNPFFLGPNYHLEDLSRMNRYWFNTNNGSCFTMIRIHMYP
ncbi:hypothetical protein BT93_L5043 [Corymbia citriodora subsp. variegata]|uniref:Ycf1 n=1 Tax=Corymbia citriodora subsp. variegata TaxID=360336 RepID=A0A8T0CSY0_CORYI|nr:hypothetical protein BT93_L5043 [Corymbia citriodora subsp. variegata]